MPLPCRSTLIPMKRLLTALLTCCIFTAFAQTNLAEGKIYTRNEVLPVFFHLKNSEGTPQRFSFSSDPASAVQEVEATSAEKIELKDGSVYQSFSISVPVMLKDYLSRTEADYAFAANWFKGKAFAERLLEGKIALYQFVDRFGFPHFFYKQAADSAITLLQNKTRLSEAGEITYDPAYKNQLAFLQTQFCTTGSTDRIDYTAKSMINVFTELNRCAGVAISSTTYFEKRKAKANVGFLGGVLSSALGFTDFKSSVNPTLGAFIVFAPGKPYASHTISVEAAYQSFNQVSDSIIYAISHSQTRIEYSLIALNTVGQFHLQHQKQSPFVEAGLNFNYAFTHRVTTTTKDVVFNSVNSSQAEGGNLFYFGVLAGAGYDFSRLSLHLRYAIMMHPNDDWIKNYWGLVARFRLTGN